MARVDGAAALSTKGLIAIIVLFAITGFVAYKVGNILPKNKYIEQVTEYRKEAQQLVKTYADSLNDLGNKYKDTLTTLQKTVDSKTVQIVMLKVKFATLAKENTILLADLRSVMDSAPPVCAPLVSACQRTVNGLQSQLAVSQATVQESERRDTLRINQLRVSERSEQVQKLRADSLSTKIMAMPKPPQLFKLINISPTQGFIAGAVATLLTIIIVK